MNRFRYSPTPSTDQLPAATTTTSTTNNLILPETVKNANVNQLIFGSFAGSIPNDVPRNTRTTNNNNSNNNNSEKPTLRFIHGNRVNIPPTQK